MSTTDSLSEFGKQPLAVSVFEEEVMRLCPHFEQPGELPQCKAAPYWEASHTVRVPVPPAGAGMSNKVERPRREVKQAKHADNTLVYRAPALF